MQFELHNKQNPLSVTVTPKPLADFYISCLDEEALAIPEK